MGLRAQIERVAAKRRNLPLGGAIEHDYAFQAWDPVTDSARPITLSQLFEGDKDTPFRYSFMVVPPEHGLPFVGPCPSCTSIIDSIDGALPHITQRINFAVSAKTPIEEFARHGASRG